jgi:hypothetical protein
MARTCARQLPRAFAFARASKRDGSPRAWTVRSEHVAALAGPLKISDAPKTTNAAHAEIKGLSCIASLKVRL